MTNSKILVEFDDIIYSLQKYGGASTYWNQVTSRVDFLLKGKTKHSRGYSWQRMNCPRSSAAVFHSSHFRITKSINVVNITTIHDLMYEKGLVKGVGRYLNLFERRRSIVNADAIICISESTKKDMLAYYGEIVHKKLIKVIYHGSQFDNDENKEVVLSNENKSSFRFFLFVGGRSGYKNFEFFLRAYSLGNFKNKDIKIICTGSNFSDQEMNLIASLKMTKFITSVGIVASDELKRLYKTAIALVYPSLYEGFGIPVLDAMTLGCPVISTNTSSIPEVVGDAGTLFEPGCIDDLIDKMNFFILDKNRIEYIARGRERAATFSWEKSANLHLDLYKYFL